MKFSWEIQHLQFRNETASWYSLFHKPKDRCSGNNPRGVLPAEIVEIGFCASVCQDSNQIFQESGMVEIFLGCRRISPMNRLLEFNHDLPFLVTSGCMARKGRVLLACIHFLMPDG